MSRKAKNEKALPQVWEVVMTSARQEDLIRKLSELHSIRTLLTE